MNEPIKKNNELAPKQATDEIDLIEVFKKIWAERKIIYRTVAIFLVLGIMVAFGSSSEYKSEVVLLPEISNQNGSGMSGLLQQFGGLSGLNLNAAAQSNGTINPALYPTIIESTPFIVRIMNQKVYISKYNVTTSVYTYLKDINPPSLIGIIAGYTVGLPGKLIGSLHKKKETSAPVHKTNGPLKLTPDQETIVNNLKGRIKAVLDETAGTIKIDVEMPDPYAAAQLTDSVVNDLTQYLVSYRVQKAQADYDFIKARQEEAERKYLSLQNRSAGFQDANRDVISAAVLSTGTKITNEYNLAFNLYNTLSQQLEQARLKVQQETPVFKVLNPAEVPLKKSKPKRSLILAAMIFLGIFVGIGIITGKMIYRNAKTKNEPQVA